MLDDPRVDRLVAWVREFAKFMDPVEHVFDYPRDPEDEPYVDLAIAAGAVYLVSWDKDIKDLADEKTPEGRRFMEQHPTVLVMDPKAFLADFYGDRSFDVQTKQMVERMAPLDPIEFRDACEELLEEAHHRVEADASFEP